MAFIYHSIFTNAHKSYVYKVINKKSGRIYTILFSFNMKSKNNRPLRSYFLLILLYYLGISQNIDQKRCYFYNLRETQRYYYCFERKKVETLHYNYLLKVCKN